MGEVRIRPALPEDATAVANVLLASFHDTYDFPLAHTDDEVRGWIASVLLPNAECWVAIAPDGRPVALMALGDAMLDQLYVAPGWSRRGIGSRLVSIAKARRPEGLDLSTFQVNTRARAFYGRHGFVEVAFGDGSENEEGQPDVRLAWRPDAGDR